MWIFKYPNTLCGLGKYMCIFGLYSNMPKFRLKIRTWYLDWENICAHSVYSNIYVHHWMSPHKPKTEWPTLLHRHLQMSEMYQQHMVWSHYILEFSNDTHCDYFVQTKMLSSLPQLTLQPIMLWIFRYHRYNSSII